MLTSGKSESELVKAAVRRKLPTGWKDGDIEEVSEDISSKENPMFKSLGSFVDEAGEKWTLRVYLVDKGKGAVLLRRLCAARGVAAKYDAGCVDASDLVGPVRMKIGIEKRRGWPARLKVEDFAPPAAASSVVNLVRAGAFVVGAVLAAASLGACSSLPVRYDAAPADYGYAQADYQPPPSYAADNRMLPGQVWRERIAQRLADMRMSAGAGLGVGAVGGFIANRALSGAGAAAVGGAEAAAVPAAEVGEAVTAGRAVGAVRAGAVAAGAAEAAEAAEGGEIIEIIEGILLF